MSPNMSGILIRCARAWQAPTHIQEHIRYPLLGRLSYHVVSTFELFSELGETCTKRVHVFFFFMLPDSWRLGQSENYAPVQKRRKRQLRKPPGFLYILDFKIAPIRHRAFRLVGRVWSTCPVFWFSNVRGLVFLFFEGPTWYYLRGPRSSFHAIFCIGFQTSFSTRNAPSKAQKRYPKQPQIIKIRRPIIIETHPQLRAAKRLRLGGVKPLKLTTFATLQLFSQKAQSSPSKAKTKKEMEASGNLALVYLIPTHPPFPLLGMYSPPPGWWVRG